MPVVIAALNKLKTLVTGVAERMRIREEGDWCQSLGDQLHT